MIAPALRLVAAVANGARLVGRPHSPVLHLYRGPLTPSGSSVPQAGRTVCRARTRRLSVLEPSPSPGLDLHGRRVCRRCMPLLPAALGRSAEVDGFVRMDDWKRTYADLTPGMFEQAGRWARTVEESHQIGMVASLVHGEKPRAPRVRLNPAQVQLADMHAAIEARRRDLVAAERSPEERATNERVRQLEAHDRQRTREARTQEAARTRAQDRARRGRYLAPWERQLVS